jgi:hypothetical protein
LWLVQIALVGLFEDILQRDAVEREDLGVAEEFPEEIGCENDGNVPGKVSVPGFP